MALNPWGPLSAGAVPGSASNAVSEVGERTGALLSDFAFNATEACRSGMAFAHHMAARNAVLEDPRRRALVPVALTRFCLQKTSILKTS